MSKHENYLAQAEAIIRSMAARGKTFAVEDALKPIITPEGVDRRCFGPMVYRLKRDGVIEPCGYRESVDAKHHSGIKRLWRAANSSKGGANYEPQ